MSDVSNIALALIDEQLRARGQSIVPALEGTGLSPEMVESPGRSRMPWETFMTICERVSESIGGLEEMEEAGMRFIHARPGILQVLAARFAKPQTIYYLGVRWYGPSLFKGVVATITYLPDGVIESLTLPADCRECPAYYHLMKGVLRGAPQLAGAPPADVDMTYRGNEVAYRARFNGADAAGAHHADEDADIENERLDADAFVDEFVIYGADPDVTIDPDPRVAAEALPLSQQVRWLLEDAGGSVDLSARKVARRLGKSERSLARGLAKESTTFSALADDIRRKIAVSRLRRGARIEDVSSHLGFADVSSFHRAFRRWTDQSPGSFSQKD